jgi:hypothetical protein
MKGYSGIFFKPGDGMTADLPVLVFLQDCHVSPRAGG